MALTLSLATRNAVLAAIRTGTGLISIRSGDRPATADGTTTTETLLATLAPSGDFFNAPSNGSMAMSGPATATVQNTGTATWFRLHYMDTGAPTCLDGSITPGGGGGDIELDSVQLVADTTLTITAWTLTIPETLT